MQQIEHKKNELFEVEFYQNKECTEAFDFTNAKNLYIDGLNGDITPLCKIARTYSQGKIYTPYIPNYLKNCIYNEGSSEFITLDDITPNLSKYIPEDNAVLFLSEEDYNNNLENIDFDKHDYLEPQKNLFFIDCIDDIENLEDLQLHKKLTIFLPHGTQAELQKAEEVGKYLWENFKIKPNLCVLHCFIPKNLLIKTLRPSRADRMYNNEIYGYEMKKICKNINKIITTNSTGILPVQNNERLQVIDCKEILEEYLKENN